MAGRPLATAECIRGPSSSPRTLSSGTKVAAEDFTKGPYFQRISPPPMNSKSRLAHPVPTLSWFCSRDTRDISTLDLTLVRQIMEYPLTYDKISSSIERIHSQAFPMVKA